MQVFADDGACIDASVYGRGHECVVALLHGFPFARDVWETQAQALAKSSCVVVPDLRGAGSSSIPDGPYLMERHAADVAILLDALGAERVALVGHSMGGYVALAFARMFTERVTRIALVASRLRADTAEEAAARRELAGRVELEQSIEPAIAAYLPRLFAAENGIEREAVVRRAYALARQNGAKGAAATLRGMALRAASEDIAGDLDVPMVMVAGGLDRVLPVDEARAAAGSFPRGRFVTCASSGHLPMLEEPERVVEALEDWLSG
jgi:3-oxoadipate enol-lactonase